jgi:ketosteroid isomerase-like protein
MSAQGNLELVRRIYDDGLFDHNHEGLLAFVAPDVEYVNPPEAVEPGARRGRDAVAQALQNMSEYFDFARHELVELFDGGATVVASVRFRTRSRGSKSDVVQEEAHTWTLRDGKVLRFEWGRSLTDALNAAGIKR